MDKTVEVSQAARELLACPFCRAPDPHWVMLAGHDRAVRECTNCKARGPEVPFELKSEPIEQTTAPADIAWNTRATQPEAALREALDEAFHMARELIQEAKGADGPNGGFVTDHLDAAENWIDTAQSLAHAALAKATAILALQSSAQGDHAVAIQVARCHLQWFREGGENAHRLAQIELALANYEALAATLSPAEPSPESREEALELLATATGDRDAWLKWYSQSQQASASVLVETALSAIRALKGPQNDR